MYMNSKMDVRENFIAALVLEPHLRVVEKNRKIPIDRLDEPLEHMLGFSFFPIKGLDTIGPLIVKGDESIFRTSLASGTWTITRLVVPGFIAKGFQVSFRVGSEYLTRNRPCSEFTEFSLKLPDPCNHRWVLDELYGKRIYADTPFELRVRKLFSREKSKLTLVQ